MSVNKAILLGRLGRDPELRYTASGTAVCGLRLATNSVFKDREGQRQERTEWHSVSVWGQQGENCSKYLSKGREVFIEGEIRTRQYEDKQGITRYATEIVAREVKFLGGGGSGSGGAGSGGAGRGGDTSGPPDLGVPEAGDDDVPF